MQPHEGQVAHHHEPPVTRMSAPPPQSHAAAPSSRRKIVVVVGALIVAAGIAGASVYSSAKKGPAKAPVARDVPTVDGDAIVFSAGFRQRAGVEMTVVKHAKLTPTFRVVGTATFDPAHVAAVGTRVRGFVRATYKYDGDEVKAGEALGTIESAEIGQAQADVAMAKALVEAAEINAKRERELLDRNLTTKREAEVAATTLATSKAANEASQQRVLALTGSAKGQFGLFVLRAPIAGHVVEAQISPGQSVEGNLLAYKVADLRWLWIQLGMPERNAGDVRVGDTVEITPVGDPARKIAGRVAHVGEVIDLSTRSTEVRIAVDNSYPDGDGHLLRPGQSVFATLSASGSSRDALVIPQSAVAYVDGKATVFVSVGENRVVPTNIKLGASDSTQVEVLEGLKDGQSVASAGVFPLKSELFR